MSVNPGPFSPPVPEASAVLLRRGGRLGRLASRYGLWGAVLVATGFLVQAEPRAVLLPEGVTIESGLVYREIEGRRLALDLYRPEGAPPVSGWPVVLALHGGGWRGGSRTMFGPDVASLAQHGVAVAVVDYRLSKPGTPSWPGNFDDVQEAVVWLRSHAESYGLDRRRIAALGLSAGGHLAAMLGSASAEASRVSAVVDFYGPADLLALGGPAGASGGPVDLLLGGVASSRPALAASASPSRQVTSDDAPMLLIHGEEDQLVPPEQSQRLADALRDAGVPCQLVRLSGEGHGFGLRVSSGDLTPRILDFLSESWHDAP